MEDLRRLADTYATWPARPEFDPDRRWYSRLNVADDHEAWLLTWLPGQSTDLHDHGGAAGAFTVLSGRLTEAVPTTERCVRLVERTYGPGTTRRFGPRHVHRIVNAGTVPAVSIHVYSPVLTRMTRYAVQAGELRTLAVEQAGRDW